MKANVPLIFIVSFSFVTATQTKLTQGIKKYSKLIRFQFIVSVLFMPELCYVYYVYMLRQPIHKPIRNYINGGAILWESLYPEIALGDKKTLKLNYVLIRPNIYTSKQHLEENFSTAFIVQKETITTSHSRFDIKQKKKSIE
ncbi:hypothetical protein BY458DRAFT_342071 [Sporodiniella umbellata]|nr:hypothetical protein BY458DRAFT_342071 [Sporodiniella umbellata]